MKWVLLKFSERLLAVNHSFKYSDKPFMSFIKSVILDWVNIILVSSANKINLDLSLTRCDKSFICRRKSKEPSMDPCGTLSFILLQFEAI
jgi:hypothetical protein